MLELRAKLSSLGQAKSSDPVTYHKESFPTASVSTTPPGKHLLVLVFHMHTYMYMHMYMYIPTCTLCYRIVF